MEILIAFAGYLGISVAQLIGFLGVLSAGAIVPNLKCLDKKGGLSTLGDLKHLTKDKNGIQLSKNIVLDEESSYEHLLILGPTGSGKSSSIFISNLLQKESFSNSQSSIIVTDPKSEIYNITSSFQRKLGRKIKVFSPYKEENSIHYNPLTFCESKTDVITLARDILSTGAKAMEMRTGGGGDGKDTVWINMATPLFASVLLYVYRLKKPYNTISNALRIIIDKEDEELEKMLLESNDEDIILQYKMYKKSATSPATAGSIQVTLTSNVQSFLTPAIEKITSYSDFKFEDLRNEKTILYMIYDTEKASDLAPLTSVFFTQLFNTCKNLNEDNHLPIFALLDELANIGKIQRLDMYVSVLRSYKISLCLGLQDKSQLKTIYGNHAETIFNNLKSLVLFSGEKCYETLRAVSSLCGEKDVLNITTSSNNKGNSSNSRGYKKEPVFPIADLKNLNENEIFIMLKSQKPILDEMNSYYRDMKYLERIM